MKTIKRNELERLVTCNSKNLPELVNDNGVRYRWVGIGWINEGASLGDETMILENDEKEVSE